LVKYEDRSVGSLPFQKLTVEKLTADSRQNNSIHARHQNESILERGQNRLR
jgi:hypothetical protein